MKFESDSSTLTLQQLEVLRAAWPSRFSLYPASKPGCGYSSEQLSPGEGASGSGIHQGVGGAAQGGHPATSRKGKNLGGDTPHLEFCSESRQTSMSMEARAAQRRRHRNAKRAVCRAQKATEEQRCTCRNQKAREVARSRFERPAGMAPPQGRVSQGQRTRSRQARRSWMTRRLLCCASAALCLAPNFSKGVFDGRIPKLQPDVQIWH